MSNTRAAEPSKVRQQGDRTSFNVRVLDARGRVLSSTEEQTLHLALACARERLRERINVDAGAHKAEVRNTEGLIFDVFAE